MKYDVIIIGAGLTGLAIARKLTSLGYKTVVLEKNSFIGGRVSSEKHDDCILDRGFQVILPSYPAYRRLNLNLPLARFTRGAWLYDGNQKRIFIDPVRELSLFCKYFQKRVGSIIDLWKLAIQTFFYKQNISINDHIYSLKYSKDFQKLFLVPFLKGILLDPNLDTPSSLSSFYLKMFFLSGAALPLNGIGELPASLASGTEIKLNQEVVKISGNEVYTTDGAKYVSQYIVVTAPELQQVNTEWLATSCMYFLYSDIVKMDRMLALCSNAKTGEVNQFTNLSEISPNYSPGNTSLFSVSCLGKFKEDINVIKDKLCDILRLNQSKMNYLKTFYIEKAIPKSENYLKNQSFITVPPIKLPMKEGNIFYASDVHSYGSQNAAFETGEKVLLEILKLNKHTL